MACYAVTYDLFKSGQNYDELIKAIKGYSNWCHLQQSVWLVVSSNTAQEVRDHLRRYIDSNDKLFVGKMAGEGAWYGHTQEVSDWLKKYL